MPVYMDTFSSFRLSLSGQLFTCDMIYSDLRTPTHQSEETSAPSGRDMARVPTLCLAVTTWTTAVSFTAARPPSALPGPSDHQSVLLLVPMHRRLSPASVTTPRRPLNSCLIRVNKEKYIKTS